MLRAYNKPIEVQELSVPQLEPRAALVEIEAATACGTDVHIVHGALDQVSRLPVLMGHEMVGRVCALGRERTHDALGRRLEEGDRVVWSYAWCGSCYWCTIARQPTLCPASRPYGWGPASTFPYLTGGFSEYAYVMAQCKVLRAPDSLDPQLIAPATCALRSVMHAYERLGRIEPHETIVVQGSGPVGLFAVAVAVRSGAAQVICIGAPDDRLGVARAWGAGTVLNMETSTPAARREMILDETERRGADVVVECSGAPEAFVEGPTLVRRGGRYLVVGQAGRQGAGLQGADLTRNQLTVIGSLGGDIPHYYRALRFLEDARGRFDVADLLGGTYSLDAVDHALESMAAGRELKPVVLPN